ncbi:MAG: glutathione transferase [Archangium sp.]
MTTELTLFVDSNFISPWALTAFVALEEKQLPYTLKVRDLDKKETFLPDFGARTQRIPALQRGEFWLAESTAIAEYLAENFPFPKHPRLYPENLDARGTCRELQGWYRSDLLPIRQERPTSTLWGPRSKTPLSEAAKAASMRLINVLAPMIGEKTTLFENWCIADVDTAVMLQRLNLNGDELPANLKRYAEANWNRPSVAKWNALKR